MMTTATSTASTAFVSTSPRYLILLLLTLTTLVHQTHAVATINDWRSRSIYQLITDRFARPDGSTTAPCVLEENKYCGGTWQGIISKLDYIQGMGFTAVSWTRVETPTEKRFPCCWLRFPRPAEYADEREISSDSLCRPVQCYQHVKEAGSVVVFESVLVLRTVWGPRS